MKADPHTIEELEHALEVVARLILVYGDQALPIFERIEREIAERRRKQEVMERVRAVAERAKSRTIQQPGAA